MKTKNTATFFVVLAAALYAIMCGREMVGELIIKNIEPGKCATMGLAMRKAIIVSSISIKSSKE